MVSGSNPSRAASLPLGYGLRLALGLWVRVKIRVSARVRDRFSVEDWVRVIACVRRSVR